MSLDCREYRRALLELARGGALSEHEREPAMIHVEQCSECGRFLEGQRALTAAMEILAAEEIPPADPFAGVVMAEFDRAQATRRGVRRWPWAIAAAIAAAACLALVAVRRPAPIPQVAVVAPAIAPPVVQTPPPPQPVPQRRPRRSRARHPQPQLEPPPEAPFLPIPYTLPLAPGERASVVRMEIPVTALLAAGFEIQAYDPASVIEADVLVSQDGRARAIRSTSKANLN